jgi:hypothetical protein
MRVGSYTYPQKIVSAERSSLFYSPRQGQRRKSFTTLATKVVTVPQASPIDFVAQAPGANVIKLFTDVTYEFS